MTNDLIRVSNDSYGRYEELLLRRDRLLKEGFEYAREYTRIFGELILAVFEKKMECIRKKKTIEFAQREINHGRSVDGDLLEAFLLNEMSEYEQMLDDMIADYENAQKGKPITELEMLEIKKIYRRLVKLIHPDINPLTLENVELDEIWHRVVIAYNCNDLKMLKELEVLVTSVLENLGVDGLEINIPDISEKIEELELEIKNIIETDPYRYKDIICSDEAIKAKKADLKEELRQYEEYSNQLEKIMEEMFGSGASFIWRMN